MKKEYRKALIKAAVIGCVLFLAIIFLGVAVLNISHTNNCQTNTTEVIEVTQPTTTQLDFTPYSTESKSISLPSTNGLTMRANKTEQEVDFYNPSTNKVLLQMELRLSDGTVIYQSSYLKPDEHVTEITLNQKLDKGVYQNCKLMYFCYALDGETPLNNAEVVLEINSI